MIPSSAQSISGGRHPAIRGSVSINSDVEILHSHLRYVEVKLAGQPNMWFDARVEASAHAAQPGIWNSSPSGAARRDARMRSQAESHGQRRPVRRPDVSAERCTPPPHRRKGSGKRGNLSGACGFRRSWRAFRMMSATRFRSKPAIDSDRCRPVGERPVVGCGWHLCVGDGRFADDVVPAADWYLAIAQRRTSLASAAYGRRRALTALLRNGPGIPPSYRAAPVRHPLPLFIPKYHLHS
jgi:hypothetical protein